MILIHPAHEMFFLSAHNSCKRSSAFQWKENHALMTHLEDCLDQEDEKKSSSRVFQSTIIGLMNHDHINHHQVDVEGVPLYIRYCHRLFLEDRIQDTNI